MSSTRSIRWFYGIVSQDVFRLSLLAGVNTNATNKKEKPPLHALAEKWNRLSDSDW
jgi:hypothetical protein